MATRMFRQDIQSFDFGFHPESILASNFRIVFYIDMSAKKDPTEEGKISVLVASQLSKYDLSFNKITQVKRLSPSRFCFCDEQMIHVYNWCASRLPQLSQRHFSSDVSHFFDIVTMSEKRQEKDFKLSAKPSDLFSDELLEFIDKNEDQENDQSQQDEEDADEMICLVSPTVCLVVNVDARQLPEVNQQIDTELYRSLSSRNKP